MTRDLTQRTTALIEHIQTRFHEGHRQALPELLTLAAAVEAQGIDKGPYLLPHGNDTQADFIAHQNDRAFGLVNCFQKES